MGLRNWEKGVAPTQDGEAHGRSWFGEEGVNKLSLRFLFNVKVETESEHWSLELKKMGSRQCLGGTESKGWMSSLTEIQGKAKD